MKIHLMYEKIDTILTLTPTHRALQKYKRTRDGRQASSVRALVFDSTKAPEKIIDADFSETLKKEDPELDLEVVGKLVRKTSRIVVDNDLEPVYTYKEFDVLTKPDGQEIERPHLTQSPNINELLPVKITDKYYKATDLLQKFVFRKSYFISHTDGVSYKFLYDIAQKLAELDRFARVVAFDQTTKKPAPIVMIAGGPPFPAAFVSGKVLDDKYCLILHLADRELKLPTDAEEEEA